MLGIPYGYDCAFGKPLASNILPDLIHENRSAQVGGRMGQQPGVGEGEINRLLTAWRAGDRDACDAVIALLFDDLKRIAHRQLVKERADHTMQTGDLVNQLYLKLFSSRAPAWSDRDHFLRSAARAMRQILIDHARGWQHRGAEQRSLDEPDTPEQSDPSVLTRLDTLLAFEDALAGLERLDPVMAEIADFRVTFGLTLEETAAVTKVPLHTVKREWVAIRKILGQML